MEEKLKKLLEDLKNQETSRKDIINEIKGELERLNSREQIETERFVENMTADIASGLYNNRTEGHIQQIIEETKNEIKQRYEAERNQLKKKMEDSQKQEIADKANDYKKINSAIKEYHTDMVLEATKAKRELARIKAEQAQKMQEIDKRIAEKEAKLTHMIMQNHKFMDIEASQVSADIKLLGIEIDELKAEKESVSSELAPKLEAQNQYVQYCIEQKERAAKFLGKISLSDKSIDEINQILFDGVEPIVQEEQPIEVIEEELVEAIEEKQPAEAIEEEQPVVVVEEKQQAEVVEEEQPVEVIEEEQQVEVVAEEQPVVVEEEQPVVVVEEEQQAEVVEEEQPVEVVEEEQQAEVVAEEKPVVIVQKEEKAEEAVEKQPEIIVNEVQPEIEKEYEIIRPRQNSEQDRNYKYFEKNKDMIVKFFIYTVGIKESEAKEIFKNKEHCAAVGEMCRKSMEKITKDTNKNSAREELISRLEDYYLKMESKLDIEVSADGITYNNEIYDPEEITNFRNTEIQFIDKIVWKYEDMIPKFNNPRKVVYDKNIIVAIAMGNCKRGTNNKLKLTPSGEKKLNQYINLIANTKYDKGTVTYDLRGMSRIKGFFDSMAWSPETVKEFRKTAYQAKDTYATVIPGFFAKVQWAIQDKIKGIRTKKLTSGEQETVEVDNKANNSWELQEDQKAYANSRSTKSNEPKVTEPEKEECK